MSLLLEADPSKENVRGYLKDAYCYLGEESGEAVAVCVLNLNDAQTLELFNIAVHPDRQGQGIGSQLLHHVIEAAQGEGFDRIELGTGTFGYQLMFYQRAGFRVQGVIKDFFIDKYDEPIHEMGIQLKDMLRLALEL